jgi:hypothetical protein
MRRTARPFSTFAILLLLLVAQAGAADRHDRWVQAEGTAAGVDERARDDAIDQALRTAAEEACGVFIRSQSRSEDYRTIYDKVLANTGGYVKEYRVTKTAREGDRTRVWVKALVSNEKFEENWASIAHIVRQENNPRVMVAIIEAVRHSPHGPVYEADRNGTVQSIVENYLLKKGLVLVDRQTTEQIDKRDVLLAVLKDDSDAVAAIGARYKADVVITGRADARFGKTVPVAGQSVHQYTARLVVRAVQTDSGRILIAETFGPKNVNTLQRTGGAEKALSELAEKAAPRILSSTIEAWRKRAHVARSIRLEISGMDYRTWKSFRDEVRRLRGLQAVNLREITQGNAQIDVDYRYSIESLADRLSELDEPELNVTEISASRIKLQVADILDE